MFFSKITPLFLFGTFALYSNGLSASLECKDFKLPTLSPSFSFSIGGCSVGFQVDAIEQCQKAMIEHVTDFAGMLSSPLSYGCEASASNNFDDRLFSVAQEGGGFFDRTSYSVLPDNSHYFVGGETDLDTQKVISKDAASFSYTGKREEQQHDALIQSIDVENCREDSTEASMRCAFKKNSSNNNALRDEDTNVTQMQTDKLFNIMIVASTPTSTMIDPSESVRSALPLEYQKVYYEIANRVISSTSVTKGHILTLADHRVKMNELLRENASSMSVPTYDKLTHELITTRKDAELP